MLTSAGGVLEMCWSSTTPTCSNVRSIQHDPNPTPARSTGNPHARQGPSATYWHGAPDDDPLARTRARGRGREDQSGGEGRKAAEEGEEVAEEGARPLTSCAIPPIGKLI